MHIYSMDVLGIEEYKPDINFDIFITAGGSDFRAYEVLRKLITNGVNISEVILFEFEERISKSDREQIEAYDTYKTLKLNVIPIPCSIMNPSECLRSLSDFGVTINSKQKVALDISCFTKPYFFLIIKYLKEFVGLDNITVYYTEPESYVLVSGLYKSYHSTKGTLQVIQIPGFPGNNVDTKEKVLVILLGFDGELSTFLSDDVAPDEVIVVNGFPSYSPLFKDISIINNEKVLSHCKGLKYAAANNPFNTYNILKSIKSKFPTGYINIAALGTKPMALGACLLAVHDPSIRMVYTLPEEYENITTHSSCQSWKYEIPLSLSF